MSEKDTVTLKRGATIPGLNRRLYFTNLACKQYLVKKNHISKLVNNNRHLVTVSIPIFGHRKCVMTLGLETVFCTNKQSTRTGGGHGRMELERHNKLPQLTLDIPDIVFQLHIMVVLF